MTEAQADILIAAIQNAVAGEQVVLAMLCFLVGLFVVAMFGIRWYL